MKLAISCSLRRYTSIRLGGRSGGAFIRLLLKAKNGVLIGLMLAVAIGWFSYRQSKQVSVEG